jgi:hypothetical protein
MVSVVMLSVAFFIVILNAYMLNGVLLSVLVPFFTSNTLAYYNTIAVTAVKFLEYGSHIHSTSLSS